MEGLRAPGSGLGANSAVDSGSKLITVESTESGEIKSHSIG